MKNGWRRRTTLLIVLAMVFQLVYGTSMASTMQPHESITYTSPTIEGQSVTFRYYDETTQAAIRVKGSFTRDNWQTLIPLTDEDHDHLYECTVENVPYGMNYEYGFMVGDDFYSDPMNPPAEGEGNSKFTVGIAYESPIIQEHQVTFQYYDPEAESILICGNDSIPGITWQPNAENTCSMTMADNGLWSCTVQDVPYGKHEYKLVVDGEWLCDPANPDKQNGNSVLQLEDPHQETIPVPEYTSPVVTGEQVTLYYFAPGVEYVNLCGTLPGTSWSPGKESALCMEETEQEGLWTYTFASLAPNIYEYKFVENGSNWVTDPKNTTTYHNNSAIVIEGMQGQTLTAEAGQSLTLPSLHYYSVEEETIKDEVVTPTYQLKEERTDVTLEDNRLEISEQASTPIVVMASYKEKVAQVTINLVSKLYTYRLHYYEPDNDYTDRALWLWTKGVGGTLNAFNESAYTDALGRTWATAVYQYPVNTLNLIVRSADSWEAYKDVEHQEETGNPLTIVQGQLQDEFWLISGDKNAYTEEPEAIKDSTRYMMIELTKPEGDYENWEIYSWTTLKGNAHFDLVPQGDRAVAIIPVASGTETFSFVIPEKASLDSDPWIKDLSADRAIKMPIDQKVVKARVTFGDPTIQVLPYNKGYEISPDKQAITFYYRDDERFKAGTLSELEKVQVEVNGTLYAMTYDEENERYTYTLENAQPATYTYAYEITDEEGVCTYELDAFNPDQQGDRSVFTYENIALELQASVAPNTIDVTENAVLSIEVEAGKEKQIKACYADLSQLGGSAKAVVDPQLLERTIAVKATVGAGTKTIPITVVDLYNRKHTVCATVNVATRDTGKEEMDWDEAVIYFMETDRFYDGDKQNNTPYAAEGVNDYDPDDPGKYHGGDLKGVTDKLDYLKTLGINTIWISPIVENVHQNVYGEADGPTSYYGYHGYWALNFQRLNPHLGSLEDLHQLIDEAHARDIKIMLDVVVNHAGYGLREGETSSKVGYPTAADQAPFVGLFREKSLNDPSSMVTSDLAGMPDFATEDAKVRDTIIGWQADWVSDLARTAQGNTIDYFRVDTVKHVDETTWRQFKNTLTTIDPHFKMIGEYYGASVDNTFGCLDAGMMDALLDFGFKETARNFVAGRMDQAEQALETRNTQIDETAMLGQFLSSHDEDGFLGKLGGNQGKFMVAATLQLTAKGQPVIYYGEEIGQTGANDYPIQSNRYDFDWTQANDQNPMYVHYKKVLAARKAYSEIFARGSREKVAGSDAAGWLVTSRTYEGKQILIGFNLGEQQIVELTLKAQAGKTLTDLYSGKNYKVDAKGNVKIMLPDVSQGGTVILPLFKEVKPSKDDDDDDDATNTTSTGSQSQGEKITVTTMAGDKKELTARPITVEEEVIHLEYTQAAMITEEVINERLKKGKKLQILSGDIQLSLSGKALQEVMQEQQAKQVVLAMFPAIKAADLLQGEQVELIIEADGKPIRLKQPITVTISLEKEKKVDLSRLIFIHYEKQPSGSLKATKLGGKEEAHPQTFQAEVYTGGSYGLVEGIKLQLTPFKRQYILNGEWQVTDSEPVIREGRMMVPLRLIAEAFGAQVKWVHETKAVHIILAGNEVVLQTTTQETSDKPLIINNRVMVPLRYVSEQLGAEVNYNETTKEIQILK